MIVLLSVSAGFFIADLLSALLLYADDNKIIVRIKRWLKKDLLKRQRFNLFPDFLDLVAMGLSAGITLQQSWESAIELLEQGALKEALMLSTEADFQACADHLNDERLTPTLIIIAQAARRGAPLQDVLYEQANLMRQARFLDIERLAQTASLRILFPLVFFILPSVFIVLLGPLFLTYLHSGSLF